MLEPIVLLDTDIEATAPASSVFTTEPKQIFESIFIPEDTYNHMKKDSISERHQNLEVPG